MPVKIEIVDESRMKQIFEPLEGIESNISIYACSQALIFSDAQGFNDILFHLESSLYTSKQ